MASTVEGVVRAMCALVPNGLEATSQDLAIAIEEAFPPVRAMSLPLGALFNYELCSCDGYYETSLDPGVPWIVYRDDVSESRIRFTLFHELGHHLAQYVEPTLLDDIDRLAGPSGDPIQIEERICNEFAGHMLIPDELVAEVLAGEAPPPRHLVALHERSAASWEAAAVRLAQHIRGQGAVVLVREPKRLAFAAPSPGLRSSWTRGSPIRPDGPLARILQTRATARQEVYRWDMPGAVRLWCDTQPVHDGLGIPVLADRPSDGSLNIIEPLEPDWKRDAYCRRCNELRTEGWCDVCRGRLCPTCGACGCWKPVAENRCPGCGLVKSVTAFDQGSGLCRDCL